MSEKLWSDTAWDEYLAWQMLDKKTLRKINELIKDIDRNGALNGIGKPEKLKYREAYSRWIDKENRLIYDYKNGILRIISCKGHYEDY